MPTDEITPEIVDNSNPNTSAAYLGAPSITPLGVQELGVKEAAAQVLRQRQQQIQEQWRQQQWLDQTYAKMQNAKDGHQQETLDGAEQARQIVMPYLSQGYNVAIPTAPENPANMVNELNQVKNKYVSKMAEVNQETLRGNAVFDELNKQLPTIAGLTGDAMNQAKANVNYVTGAPSRAEMINRFYGSPNVDDKGNNTGGLGGTLYVPKPFDPKPVLDEFQKRATNTGDYIEKDPATGNFIKTNYSVLNQDPDKAGAYLLNLNPGMKQLAQNLYNKTYSTPDAQSKFDQQAGLGSPDANGTPTAPVFTNPLNKIAYDTWISGMLHNTNKGIDISGANANSRAAQVNINSQKLTDAEAQQKEGFYQNTDGTINYINKTGEIDPKQQYTADFKMPNTGELVKGTLVGLDPKVATIDVTTMKNKNPVIKRVFVNVADNKDVLANVQNIQQVVNTPPTAPATPTNGVTDVSNLFKTNK